MREILVVQVGQCGNNIGQALWKQLSDEHNVDPEGNQTENTSHDIKLGTHTYFEERKDKWVPRSLQIDMGISSIDIINKGPLRNLYSNKKQISSWENSSGIWATAMYSTQSNQLCELFINAAQKQLEACDSISAVHIVHATSGGTGSGLTCKLQNRIADQYPDLMKHNITVLPWINSSDSVLSIYNTIMSFHHLVELSWFTNLIHNESLQRICLLEQHAFNPTFPQMNSIVARLIGGTTYCQRFPGSCNTNLRKMAVNMVPFPRMHFFNSSVSINKKCSLQTMVDQSFEFRYGLNESNWKEGRFFTTASLFAGSSLSNHEAEKSLNQFKNKNSERYVEWIADNCHIGVSEFAGPTSLTTHMNSSSVRLLYKYYAENFTRMFRRKAFLQHYVRVGSMDEMEFVEAESNLNDLLSEYPESMYYVDDDMMEFEEDPDDDYSE